VKQETIIKIIILLISTTVCLCQAEGKTKKKDKNFLGRLYGYINTIPTDSIPEDIRVYSKSTFDVDKRNILLMGVPTLYHIEHGKRRHFIGESYSTLKFKNTTSFEEHRHIDVTSLPHHRHIFPTITGFLTPDLYRTTMFKKSVLSPFVKTNKKYYSFHISMADDSTVILKFKPRLNSTQLVKGFATVDYNTGRIKHANFSGEFDMIKFNIDVDMFEKGFLSLLPKVSRLKVWFNFLGNKVRGAHSSFFGRPHILPDSIRDLDDRVAFDTLRAEPLNKHEARLYFIEDSLKEAAKLAEADTTIIPKKRYFWENKKWERIGDNLFNSVRTNFGTNNKGWLKLTALLNPQYFSYSHTKGFTYRYDLKLGYVFTPNRNLYARVKTGYRTKQHRFFLQLPFDFNYNLRRNGRLQLYVDMGNIIRNSSIQNEIFPEDDYRYEENRDTYNLYDFVNYHWALTNNYDISDYVSFNAGVGYYTRSALHKDHFKQWNLPTRYNSVALSTEWTWRPTGWDGANLSLSYEWGKGLDMPDKAKLDYHRLEIDARRLIRLRSLCSLSLRLGAGCYLDKRNNYFLDYKNFHENNLPGGWNDDWTGDFQLLSYNWYNFSNYYVRANVTYERPFMLAAWIPLVGRFIESERMYTNALSLQELSPYVEFGYGFTTRFACVGLFFNLVKGKIEGTGARFTFELFKKW